ncbi:MAG: beta-3-deoxy-D-manno-oct-2-ulosonic acid transferase [Chlorobiaceae bacterium]|nr:beta-3-deoxy-D-manno-oct-2-ulosonic acid transferase [Chlorobiaceae bacterium]
MKQQEPLSGSLLYAYGFSLRKQSIVRRYAGNNKVHFISQVAHLPSGSSLLLWGSHPVPSGLTQGVQIIRLEDGFLRSVGLGADLIQPLSLVADRSGIYYDATKPSDLELLLQSTSFSTGLIERASQLRCRIVEHRVTKYSTGSKSWQRPPELLQTGQRVLLVAGQVETDASIRFGAPVIQTNIGLLKAVKEADPDAYIIYKPHPDVTAGLRAKGQGEDKVSQWCNEIVSDVSMGELLTQVDEVHVMTSLTGFEALLREKPVTCYGQPFYAGWGLTSDMVPVSRRTRKLSLEMLAAGALILYPIYVSRKTGKATTPENALDELVAWKESSLRRSSVSRKMARFFIKNLFSQP